MSVWDDSWGHRRTNYSGVFPQVRRDMLGQTERSPERDSHITPGAADHLDRRWLMPTIVASAEDHKTARPAEPGSLHAIGRTDDTETCPICGWQRWEHTARPGHCGWFAAASQ